jgi:hypothetical protein
VSDDQDLSAIFGPCAKFSEYAIGQVVRYVCNGLIRIGTITWTTPPDEQHPLEYWVGLDCLYQTDILQTIDNEEPDTALLTLCPYCGRTHAKEGADWCRNKQRK